MSLTTMINFQLLLGTEQKWKMLIVLLNGNLVPLSAFLSLTKKNILEFSCNYNAGLEQSDEKDFIWLSVSKSTEELVKNV